MSDPNFNIHWDEFLAMEEEDVDERLNRHFRLQVQPEVQPEVQLNRSDTMPVEEEEPKSNAAINEIVDFEDDDDNDWCTQIDLDPAVLSNEKVKSDTNLNCVEMSADDVQGFIEEQENVNTRRKTLCDTDRFQRFLESKGECREMNSLPPDELDQHIANYILSVRRHDGSEYEPSSLRAMVASIDRKLKRMRYKDCIFGSNPDSFRLTKEALKAKSKFLKKKGKGNRPNAAHAITDEEIGSLYDRGLLGTTTPEALLNTLWLNNSMHFGMRGITENHELRWGDVKLQRASDGVEYLELNERQTKTRTGENLCDVRPVTPKMYATGKPNCPVECYKVYAKKRPENYSAEHDPFYLSTRTVPVKNEHDQWFMRQRVGSKKVGSLLKCMAQKGQLDPSKRLTSHSTRKHLVQKLRNSNIAPTDIMQISGHKNVQSIINYSEIDENNQRKCSNILSECPSKNCSVDASAKSCPDRSTTAPGPERSASVTSTTEVLVRPSCSNTVTVSSVPHPSLQLAPSTEPREHPNINTMSVSSHQWQSFQSTFYGANLHINTMNVYCSSTQAGSEKSNP